MRLTVVVRDRVQRAFGLSPEPADWAGGIRMATMVVIPLAAFLVFDQPENGSWTAITALHIGVVDTGGGYADRLRAALAATATMAATVVLATLVATTAWAVVLLTMLWMFAGALAAGFGARAARVGLVTAITFVVGAAVPAPAADALARGGLFIIGGLWGVLVTVFMWPLRHDGPMVDAIAGAFDRIAAYVETMPHDPTTAGAERPAIAGALVAARDAALAYRRSRAGHTAATTSAVAALDTLDTLELGLDTLDEASRDVHDPAVADTLAALAAHCRRCAQAVRARAPMPAHQTLAPPSGGAESAGERTVREGMAMIDTAFSRLAQPPTTADPRRRADAPGPDGPGLRSRLLGLLDRDSIVFRHASRLAVIVGVAQVVAQLDPFTNASWIPLTVIVVLKPDIGSTLERGIQRIVGTVVGAAAALVAVEVFSDDVWVLVGALAIIIFSAAAVMPRNYGLAVIGITPAIILMYSIGGAQLGLIDVRVGSTLVGGVLALAGGWLLWPLWQAQHLPHLLADGARRAADFSAAVAAPPPTSVEVMWSTHRQAERARSDAESALQKMLSEPQAKWVAPDAVMRFCVQLRRVVGDLTALQLDVRTAGDATSGLPPTTRTAVNDASTVLRTVGDRVEGGAGRRVRCRSHHDRQAVAAVGPAAVAARDVQALHGSAVRGQAA